MGEVQIGWVSIILIATGIIALFIYIFGTQKKKWSEKLSDLQSKTDQTISDLKDHTDKLIMEEKESSRKALQKEREQIIADIASLEKKTDKELLIKTVIALNSYSSRFDQMEEASGHILKSSKDEIQKAVISLESSIKESFKHELGILKKSIDSFNSQIGETGASTIKAINDAAPSTTIYDEDDLMSKLEDIMSKVGDTNWDIGNVKDSIDSIQSDLSTIKWDIDSLKPD